MHIQKKRRNDVQVLRGVAVLGVVLFHFDKNTFYFGYLGVDIFFVISGLVITPLIEELILDRNPRKSLILFYEDRFRRLNPALIIVITFFLVIFVSIGPLSELRTLTSQIIATLIFVGNIQAYELSQGNYFNPNPNAFLHTWSLSVEQQIYFSLPLIFFLVFSKRKKLSINIYFTTLVLSYLIFFLSSFKNILGLENIFYVAPELMYYLPVSRFWEFFLGALVYKIMNRNNNPKENGFIYFILIFLILIFSISSKHAEFICTVVAFMIVKSKFVSNKNFIFETFIWLGNKSYAIYLTHLPVFYLFENSPKLINFDPTLRHLTSFAVILLSSWIISDYFEHNWRRDKKTSWSDFIKVLFWFLLVPLMLILVLRIGTLNYFWVSSPPKIQGTIDCVNQGRYGECNYDILSAEDKILLVGDSHAAAISKSFVAVSRKLGLNPVIMSGRGCQITSVDTEILSKKTIASPPRDCQEFNSNILSFLELNPSTLVVVMERNPLSPEALPSKETLDRSIAGISQLAETAKKVIVLGFVPEFKKSQSQGTLWSLLSENMSASRENLQNSSFSTYKKFSDKLNSKNIHFFDIVNVFCTKSTCKYKHEGEYLYWDEHHLSIEGARYAENFIESAIYSTTKTKEFCNITSCQKKK